ncbi:RluA family pseudouridine synthase [Intestinibacillus massiliensis]|uniref:RluA family pseudouridine synthase n=1 Tax=Intestinibacillus massiliensis TaxID=1871029 RepID=UPI000B355244|nr:RluA family pseudouridine synthase [Intestinibacillus massiliensis]
MEQRIYIPGAQDAGMRVDSYLSAQEDAPTRSAVQKLLAEGHVTADGVPVKKNYKIRGGETLAVDCPPVRELGLVPQDLPLDIVYEDADIIVVNKARGMVVHPAAGNWDGTLVNALMFHCGGRLSGINGELRPGIVHRIDKDTSGLLVVAKNDRAHQHLAAQIQRHAVRREYEAIVCGTVREDAGTVDKPVGRHRTDRKKMAVVPDGREAVTHFTVVARYPGYTHLRFELETGRTHQIRVHMAAIGHPIIGDPLYGQPKDRFAGIGGQCLHAWRLTLTHPATGEELSFTAPRPASFEEILQKLEKMT